ncbi:MAG: DUF192 domain-containing protein [Balneolaceae bacterium]|nr:DUF192 domain-containing protein [Balneolaceae bacterium]
MKYRLSFNNPLTTTLLLAAILCLGACGKKESAEPDNRRSQGRVLDYTREVRFLSESGRLITAIRVAVADEASERNMGLMDVNELPENRGMLFIFEENEPRSFWMANTPLSLDIIFVNSAFEIVRIHHSTQPFSDKSLTSGDPAKYVVETNAGFCISHDIQEGMMVRFDAEKPDPAGS